MKKFASTVILLLCMELFLPYAFVSTVSAEEAEPLETPPSSADQVTYCGGVTVHKIADEDRQRLWDATLGFTATEINDLARADALANDLSFDNPMTGPAKNLGFYAQSIPVTQLATLLGENPVDTATGLGMENRLIQGKVPEDLEVNIVTARAYAESRGKKNDFVDALRELGLLPPAGSDATIPTDPVQELKITLPESGNEIALSDLYKLEAQNPESCMLDETFAGRASYAALLDSDLTYGTYSSEIASGEFVYAPTEEVNGDPDDENATSNQHFTADSTLAAATLQNAQHILIPSFYDNWVRFAGGINDFEFYAGMLFGTLAMKNREVGVAYKEKLQADINRLNEEASRTASAISGKKLTDEFVEKTQKDFTKTIGQVQDKGTLIADKIDPDLIKFKTISQLAGRKVFSSLAFGLGWMGPARMMFQLSNGMLFRMNSRGESEYLKLIINREVSSGFKDVTGLMGLGKLLERFTSDVGVVVPDEAFSPGKVILINKAQSTQTSTKQDSSVTSLKAGEKWSISTNWRGQSDSTNFEDVRGTTSDDYTKMTFKTNKVLPTSIIERKFGSEIYDYAVGIGLPLVIGWRTSKELSQGFGVGFALMMVDMVTSTVPDDYGKGMECSKEELDGIKAGFITWLVIAEVWELGATVVLPSFKASEILYKPAIQKQLLQVGGYKSLRELAKAEGSKVANELSKEAAKQATEKWSTIANEPLQSIGRTVFGEKFSKTFSQITSLLTPTQIVIWIYNDLGTQYVTNCKDSQYKILAYKKLEGGEEPAANATNQITQGIDSITDALGIGSASETSYSGAATEEQLEGMSEILNFKAVMTNQVGAVQPEELYYFQIEKSAWSVKGGLFDKLGEKGCKFTENYQNGDQTVSLSTDGIYIYNEDGSVRLALTDYWSKVRALSRMRSQENGLVVLPNKIIEAPLNCEGAFIEVNGAGTATLDSGCETGECLLEAIEGVLGRAIGNDLSAAIGKVSSVDTTKGTATFSDSDGVRFLYLGNEYEEKLKELQEPGTGPIPDTMVPGSIDEEKFGTEVTAPNAANAAKTTRLEVLASKLTVNGDGSVTVTGPGTPKTGIGDFRTLYGSRGKIEFDGSTIMVFIYSLAETSAQNIKDISATVNNESEIGLKVEAKTGAEEAGDELNAALKSIQGEEGIKVLETEDKTYYLTEDGKLRVIDKETGEAKEYDVKSITTDADGNIVVETDDGTFKFNLGMENGQPMLSATGPDGLSEVLALLAARGDEGMLSFNPSTGAINVYNGQDVPLSSQFQTKGIAFMGDENGNTYGIPANNPFTTDWSTTGTSSKKTGLTLSAWPEEGWLAALMMLFVLAGVAFIRKQEEEMTSSPD